MRYLQRGLTANERGSAWPGFTLFSPQYMNKTVIVNMTGEVVHEWTLPSHPGAYGYLLNNGNLLVSTLARGGPDGKAALCGMSLELDLHGRVPCT
jgi:hypothetical protein